MNPTEIVSAVAEMIAREREIPSGQVWPVRIDGQQVYLSLESYTEAIETLLEWGFIRQNRVSGKLVWRGRNYRNA